MTASPTPIERVRRKRAVKGGLYVTDEELIEMLGIPARVAWPIIRELDAKHRETGFPQKSKLFGGERRYKKKVLEWLDRYEGVFPQERKSA